MKLTIFYSWQMKTDTDVNKNFIEKCLNKAAKNIENTGNLKRVFFNVVDRYTFGKSGSPHIETTILKKIADCNIFVGDLTIHHILPRDIRKELKNILKIESNAEPAGNVLYEYGRAAECVTDECVIAVSNTAYCTFKEQIFDLNHYRKPIEYCFKPNRLYKKYNSIKNRGKNNFFEKCFCKLIEKRVNKYLSYGKKVEEDFIKSLEIPLRMAAEVAIQLKDKKYLPFIPHIKQRIKGTIYDVGKFSEIKDLICLTKEYLIRVKGMSGLGKTTLVYKAFDNEDIKNDYRYFDLNEDPLQTSQIIFSINKAIEEKEALIFVIDNCPINFFYSLKSIISYKQVYIRIITISNDYTENEKGITYFIFNKDDTKNVIETMLSYRNKISDETKKQIIDIAYGNTKLVELLLDSINDSGDCSVSISNSEIMDKLLKAEKDTDERKILQSFALFKYLGLFPPREDEYKLIAKDANFSPLSCPVDVRESKFFEVYKSHEAIFERSGSLVGIRPLPLAYFLIEEWFNACSPTRMKNVVQILDSDPQASNLVEPFCLQIRYLNDNKNAVELVTKLVSHHGPFGNAEVLSSEIESRLFRSFAEVAPEAVAENLYINITKLSFESIKKETLGRRNTVWTLQTLCFDKRSFNNAAKTLLHISVAENEVYGNNATNEFTHLFSIYLPGTETSLEERFKILSWAIENKDYKSIVIKSLYSVFEFEHIVYCGGAERQGARVLQHYEPTKDEIIKYFENCFNLLKNEIICETEFKEECKNIICNSLRCLCRFGYIDFILPKIIELVNAGNKDWDELVKSINSVKTYDLHFIEPESYYLLDECLDLIKKDDFFSRFILAGEMESYGKQDFATFKNLQEKRYKELAEEFSKIDNYDEDNIRIIYSKECYFSRVFGIRLAELWINEDDKCKNFISKSLDILINAKESYPTFFVAFLEKTTRENYDYCINILKENELKNSLIFKLGSIRNTSFEEFSFIFDLIQKDNKLASFLFDFSQWHNWVETTDSDIEKFFLNAIKISSLRSEIIYRIAFRIFAFQKIERYKKTFEFVRIYTKDHYMTFSESERNSFYEFAEAIFRDNTEPDFAELVNEVLLYSLSKNYGYEGNGHYETLFNILMEKYFDNVFQKISSEFLNQNNPFEHFNLVNIFRTVYGSYDENKEMIFFFDHKEKYLKWCDDNTYAPVFLAEIISVYGDNDISQEAKLLIERYYDRPNLLRNISINMGNIMCSGSIVPALEHKRRIYEQFMNSTEKEIKEWAKLGIESVNEEIKYHQTFEDEQDFVNGV